MNRSISPFGLTLASISAIIGSGWLFACFYVATLSGPAAILAWIIGGIGVIIIAFVFGETCALIPITGSSARVPQFTHGSVVNFAFSWIIWLSYLSYTPAEVQAVIQYAAFYFPGLINENASLTESGYITATCLMLFISIINIYSLRWLIRFNNLLTIIKIIIPLLVALTVIYFYFSISRTIHPMNSTFMPYGIQGIFSAIATGGIIFAFNGFKQAAEMAGEAKNPKHALPIAIIGSVVICLIIFLLLQIAFLNSLTPENFVSNWQNLSLPAKNSPLAAIMFQDKLTLLMPLLFICAIIAPLAAALMYCSSAGRSLYGMSKNREIPKIFQILSAQGNPINAIILNFVIGMFMFAPLPGWKSMVAVISSLAVVNYSVGPITLLALRRQLPNRHRPFKLPFADIWATVAFYICTLAIYWCGWHVISKLFFMIMLAFIVLLLKQFKERDAETALTNKTDWRSSAWVWVYFTGITIISYLGSFGGGKKIITFGWDFSIIFAFCVFVIWLSLKYKLPNHRTENYVNELELEI